MFVSTDYECECTHWKKKKKESFNILYYVSVQHNKIQLKGWEKKWTRESLEVKIDYHFRYFLSFRRSYKLAKW